MKKLPLARTENTVLTELDKEILIYDLTINKAYCLNETSSIVYQFCDGKTTFAELSAKNNLTNDIIFMALDQLNEANLLEKSEEYNSPFNGMSRREVIRKAGLTSMIALPFISFLVAPTAAIAAASGCVNPNGAPAGTYLGGAGGTGDCNVPGTGDAACTSVRGNLCCSGKATADSCNNSLPGPNAGTFSVACRCA